MKEDAIYEFQEKMKNAMAAKISAARELSSQDDMAIGGNHDRPTDSEASPGASSSVQDAGASSPDPSIKIPAARKPVQKFIIPKSAPEIYDDTDVCRLLRIKRRALVNARKLKTKGSMWNIVGHHAGMTTAWIVSQNAFADIKSIHEWAIKPDDGVVTVEIVARTTNSSVIKCRRLSDDAIVSVWTGNTVVDLPNGSQFDAIEEGGRLKWSEALNGEIY